MRQLFAVMALSVVMVYPAYAEEDCSKSWNAYDLNADGYLSGEEARRFRDDMKIRGVIVGETRDRRISARQYNNACVNNYWEKIDEEG